MYAQKKFCNKDIWLNWLAKQNNFGNYRLT